MSHLSGKIFVPRRESTRDEESLLAKVSKAGINNCA